MSNNMLLSINQAAACIGVGRSTLYKELADGALLSVKVGGRRLIPTSAIDNYIDRLIAAATPVEPTANVVRGEKAAA